MFHHQSSFSKVVSRFFRFCLAEYRTLVACDTYRDKLLHLVHLPFVSSTLFFNPSLRLAKIRIKLTQSNKINRKILSQPQEKERKRITKRYLKKTNNSKMKNIVIIFDAINRESLLNLPSSDIVSAYFVKLSYSSYPQNRVVSSFESAKLSPFFKKDKNNKYNATNSTLNFKNFPTHDFKISLLTLIKKNPCFYDSSAEPAATRNIEQPIVSISVLKAFYLIAASIYNAYPQTCSYFYYRAAAATFDLISS